VLGGDNREDSRGNVDKMFELILGGRPTDHERDQLLSFIRTTQARLSKQGDDHATGRAWSIACHALFASSRFQILD
jgi:hypothetical protein